MYRTLRRGRTGAGMSEPPRAIICLVAFVAARPRERIADLAGRRSSGRLADHVGRGDELLGLADRGDVDQPAVERDRALPLPARLLHRGQDAPGALDLLLGRGEDLVGERHLRGVDRPLALAAEHGRAPRLGADAVGVGEVAERAVDRPQARRARRSHQGGGGVVPHVAPVGVALAVLALVGQDRVVGARTADDGGTRTGAGRVVGDAEVQALVALGGAGDLVDVRHAERGLDDQLEADPLLAPLRLLDLGDQHVDGVDVRRGADLRDHDQVEPVARLLEDVDQVAVHVGRVEAVDADGEGLRPPVDLVDALDDVPARLLLLVRRHRVLEIEEDHVGGTLRGLPEELRARAGDGELGAVQARRRLLDQGEAHGRDPRYAVYMLVPT